MCGPCFHILLKVFHKASRTFSPKIKKMFYNFPTLNVQAEMENSWGGKGRQALSSSWYTGLAKMIQHQKAIALVLTGIL